MAGEIAVVKPNRKDYMTPGQRAKSLLSLQLYLEGNSWPKVKEKGGYSWREFSGMLALYPDLSKAYQEARKSSAHSFEDKALDLAAELTGPNEFTGTQVRAHEVAMGQYRWSAARRNPTEYAEAGANKVSLVVPIQINSSLNLAEPGAVTVEASADPYQIAAQTVAEPPPASESFPEVEVSLPKPEIAPEKPLDALAERLGLPDEVPKVIKQRLSPGRPLKGHRSARVTGANRGIMLKKAKRNPVVARALGLEYEKEPKDGRTDFRGRNLANNRRNKSVQQPPSGDSPKRDE